MYYEYMSLFLGVSRLRTIHSAAEILFVLSKTGDAKEIAGPAAVSQQHPATKIPPQNQLSGHFWLGEKTFNIRARVQKSIQTYHSKATTWGPVLGFCCSIEPALHCLWQFGCMEVQQTLQGHHFHHGLRKSQWDLKNPWVGNGSTMKTIGISSAKKGNLKSIWSDHRSHVSTLIGFITNWMLIMFK